MMVLDTNVVSETMAKQPDQGVIRFLDALEERAAVTVITVAEIRYGIAVLPAGARKRNLAASSERVFAALGSAGVLPFDEPAASDYANIAAARRQAGKPISQADAIIAAICRHHEVALATRNVDDFAGTGIVVVNPWDMPRGAAGPDLPGR